MGQPRSEKALRLNNAMVWVKFGVIFLFIVFGAFSWNQTTGSPYALWFSGVFNGAALVFFAFLGFDAVAMAAEEVEDAKKNVLGDHWVHCDRNSPLYHCHTDHDGNRAVC